MLNGNAFCQAASATFLPTTISDAGAIEGMPQSAMQASSGRKLDRDLTSVLAVAWILAMVHRRCVRRARAIPGCG